MAKHKLKIGTQVKFSFAGIELRGEIEAITIDESYSVTTEWYKVRHTDGTIYPLRIDNNTIKLIK